LDVSVGEEGEIEGGGRLRFSSGGDGVRDAIIQDWNAG
jgi:hypothetical protein